MGMADIFRWRYPLPLAGVGDVEFQTKDTPSPFMDRYAIRGDGILWHQTDPPIQGVQP